MARDDRRGGRRRLDQPRELGRTLRPSVDPERVGRLSERVARYLGSWQFIGQMTVVIVVWIGWNLLAPDTAQWDPYTRGLVLLTLILSLQASYAAPLILLAANRQADRDRVQYQEDRARTDRLIADTEYLTREIASLRVALGEVATRDYLRGELRDLVEDLEERDRLVRAGNDGEPSGEERADTRRRRRSSKPDPGAT